MLDDLRTKMYTFVIQISICGEALLPKLDRIGTSEGRVVVSEREVETVVNEGIQIITRMPGCEKKKERQVKGHWK